jgi:DNA mismatch repair ATPase MutL
LGLAIATLSAPAVAQDNNEASLAEVASEEAVVAEEATEEQAVSEESTEEALEESSEAAEEVQEEAEEESEEAEEESEETEESEEAEEESEEAEEESEEAEEDSEEEESEEAEEEEETEEEEESDEADLELEEESDEVDSSVVSSLMESDSELAPVLRDFGGVDSADSFFDLDEVLKPENAEDQEEENHEEVALVETNESEIDQMDEDAIQHEIKEIFGQVHAAPVTFEHDEVLELQEALGDHAVLSVHDLE